MFTGIIREIGTVKGLSRKGSSARLIIDCSKIKGSVEIGDSVAVNGVCLSVVEKNGKLVFDVIGNTLITTGLNNIKKGDKVNLENALKLGDSVGGHMVSGHIDGQRRIKNFKKTSKGLELDIALNRGDDKYLISKGSVAIDGISLTVGDLSKDHMKLYIIPHTVENTILKLKRTGDYVNLEFDMMAKYAEKGKTSSKITNELLREKGFM